MNTYKRIIGLAIVALLLLAACSSEEPQAPDPSTGSTVPGSADCGREEGDTPYFIDIDDDGSVETIFLRDSDDGAALVVCFGDIAHHEMELVGQEIEIVGFNDLDDDGTGEILISKKTTDGRELNAVVATQRGLRLSGLKVLDAELAPTDEPFTADSFQCIDWDEDGLADLIHWQFMPADGEVNVRAFLVELDGLDPIEGALDSYETSAQAAYEILQAADGCQTGETALRPLRFSANGWAAVALDPSLFGVTDDLVLTAAASTDASTVVVGTHRPNLVYGELDQPEPVAWWTTDGLAWSAAQVPGTDAEILDVMAMDGDYIAVGRVGADPAIWHSTDGATWEVTSLDTNAEGGQAVIYAVEHDPEVGFMAAGAEFYWPEVGGFQDSDAVVWTSADGIDWDRSLSSAFGSQGYQPNEGSEFNGAAYDIAYARGLGIVALGHDSDSNPDIDYPTQYPSVWVSENGSDWVRSRLDTDARLTGMTVADGVIVAFGTTDLHGSPTADGALITSTDALTWTPLAAGFGPVEEPDGIQTIHSIHRSADGSWLAVGSDQTELDSTGAAAVWKSQDLETWQRVEHAPVVFGSLLDDPAQFMLDATLTPSGLTLAVGGTGITTDLVGGSSTCCTYEPQVWLFDPSRLSGN